MANKGKIIPKRMRKEMKKTGKMPVMPKKKMMMKGGY